MSSTLNNTDLMGTGISLSIVTTAVFAARMYLVVVRKRTFAWEDGWLVWAWIVFVALVAISLNSGEAVFRLQDFVQGNTGPYPAIVEDSLLVQKTFFVAAPGLWVCLWSVKASLLSLYKRLMGNLRHYIIMWWIVVVICLLTLAGAIASSVLTCSSLHDWFAPGACQTPRDVRAAYISLWYSYAVDVFTDLLVMMLPLGLIRNLQMHWKRKASVAGLFCLGWVCIAVSTIRATYLGNRDETSKFQLPTTSWIALWGIVEASIAVIIGCCPGLYREAKVLSSTRRHYYENNSNDAAYIKPSGGRSEGGSGSRNDLELQGRHHHHHHHHRATVHANEGGTSQEELVRPAASGDKIVITQSVRVTEFNAAGADRI